MLYNIYHAKTGTRTHACTVLPVFVRRYRATQQKQPMIMLEYAYPFTALPFLFPKRTIHYRRLRFLFGEKVSDYWTF